MQLYVYVQRGINHIIGERHLGQDSDKASPLTTAAIDLQLRNFIVKRCQFVRLFKLYTCSPSHFFSVAKTFQFAYRIFKIFMVCVAILAIDSLVVIK